MVHNGDMVGMAACKRDCAEVVDGGSSETGRDRATVDAVAFGSENSSFHPGAERTAGKVLWAYHLALAVLRRSDMSWRMGGIDICSSQRCGLQISRSIGRSRIGAHWQERVVPGSVLWARCPREWSAAKSKVSR